MSDAIVHSAPFESPSHQAFLNAIEGERKSTDIAREILWCINAHEHLVAFDTAANRLLQIISRAPPEWAQAIKELGLLDWRPLLEWITKNQSTLAKAVGPQYRLQTNTADSNPVMGKWEGATLFPAYTALCSIVPRHFGDQYRLLIGQFILAHIAAIRDNTVIADYESHVPNQQWEAFPTKPDTAALAVREFGEDASESVVLSMPVTLSPEAFAEALETLKIDEARLARRRDSLSRFLQKCWGMLDWDERDYFAKTGGAGKGGGRWVGGRCKLSAQASAIQFDVGDVDDPAANWGSTIVVSKKSAGTAKQRKALKSDLCPDELDEDEEIVLSNFSCTETQKDIGSVARSARAKGRHVVMANQMLPWSYDMLSIGEVAELIRRATAEFLKFDGNYTDPLAQSLALLQVMLWTGSDLERACALRFVDDDEVSNADCELAICIGKSGRNAMWRIRAISPDYATEVSSSLDSPDTHGQLRPHADFVWLPDLMNCNWFVRRARTGESTRRVFLLPESKYRGRLRKWLADNFPGSRITETKITNFLALRLFREDCDPAVIAAITGREHRLARVRLFYTATDMKYIREQYRQAIASMKVQVYAALGKDAAPEPEFDLDLLQGGSVGSRLCPTRDSTRGMVRRLIEDIQIASEYSNRSDFIRYHNLYTLYTVLAFGYATTCRAIKTPYQSVDSINPVTGLGSLSDKDDENFHKTRLVWIPNFLREHMAHHQRHHDVLKHQVPRNRRAASREPCFFLDERMVPIAASPKTIEPLLAPYLQVPANTHRRFIRTELIETGCPNEVVDALMGHWQQGEEPFGKFSSFSFERYVKELQRHLLPLLQDLGFKPLASALAP